MFSAAPTLTLEQSNRIFPHVLTRHHPGGQVLNLFPSPTPRKQNGSFSGLSLKKKQMKPPVSERS